MKAIVFMAGKGSRMYPIGITTPKILTPIFNKPLFDNFVEILKDHISEMVIVIDNGEFGQKIRDYVDSKKWPFNINFAIQKEAKGSASALQCAKNFFERDEKFLCMNGDDIYKKEDVENLLKNEYGLVGIQVSDPEKWGILKTNVNDELVELVEKPKENVGNLGNIGLYLVDASIFDLFDKIPLSPRGEYEITDSMTLFAKNKKMKVIKSSGWIPVGYPWSLLQIHESESSKLEYKINGNIEENVVIKGNLSLGEDSLVKSGCYFEGNVIIGENCTIGPNAYIRGTTVIGDNCNIGNGVEIKNSTLFTNVKVPHLSYIGDSIIGHNVNFSGGSITANYRFDKQNIKTMVKDVLVDTGRTKLGTVIGDNVTLGINTSILPGRKIWPNSTTLPGSVVDKDIVD